MKGQMRIHQSGPRQISEKSAFTVELDTAVYQKFAGKAVLLFPIDIFLIFNNTFILFDVDFDPALSGLAHLGCLCNDFSALGVSKLSPSGRRRNTDALLTAAAASSPEF